MRSKSRTSNIVALPSVMFVLLEVAVEGWLIARRERRVVPWEWCVVVHGCGDTLPSSANLHDGTLHHMPPHQTT